MTQASESSFDRLKEVYSEVAQTYKNQPSGKMGGHIIQKWAEKKAQPATAATKRTGQGAIPKEIPEELKLTLSQEFQVLNNEIEANAIKLAKLRRQRSDLAKSLGREDFQPCFDDLKELLEAHTELNKLLSNALDAKTKLQLSGFYSEAFKDEYKREPEILKAIDRLDRAIQKFPAAKDTLDNLLEKAQEALRITQEKEPENKNADKLYEKQQLLWSIRRCLNLWQKQQVQTPEVAASQFAERVRTSVDVLYDAINPNNGNPPSTFRELFQNARNRKTTPYFEDFSNFINMIKEFVIWLCRGLEFGFTEKFSKRPDETEVEMTDMHRASLEEKTKEIGNKLFEIAFEEMTDFIKQGAIIEDAEKRIPHRTAIEIAYFQFEGKKDLQKILRQIVEKKNEIAGLKENDESTENAKTELEKLREQTRKFGLDETSFETQENLFAAFDTIRTTYQQQHKTK